MNFSPSVTELAYYGAGLLSLIFACIVTIRYRHVNVGKTFCVAAYVNALWLFSIAILDPISGSEEILLFGTSVDIKTRLDYLLVFEVLHYGAWVIAFTKSTQRYCRNCIPNGLRYFSYLAGICLPIIALVNLKTHFLSDVALRVTIWSGIVFSVLCLLIIEQLYRNMTSDRLIRLICVALALIFLYDAFLFSQNLVALSLGEALWQIRASVIMVAFIFMSIGIITLQSNEYNRAKLSFSQPAVFYTTSLTITGLILLLLATGGYYVKFNDTSWGTVVYSLLVAVGLISIVLTFSSDKLRRRLNVAINKHLFNYKYDYRNEWLRLIRLLSQPTEHNESASRAIAASASLFRCESGALWQKRGSVFQPTVQMGSFDTSIVREEPLSTGFSRVLKTGWIFAPEAIAPDMTENNELIPGWLKQMKNCWLIFPLLVEEEITGFMVLTDPIDGEHPNWEDLDLVKTVGRQVANYLARHEQSELLAQARQFETFNKLSAFVMHDLKNLIAQQSLVVKNAEKHKDNPAFVDDAINTIKNSVDRMNILLRKLRQNEPEETKVLKVKDILIDAVKRCQKTPPAPTLANIEDDLLVKADFDSLVMVFTHLIHNAQDATPQGGYIDIYSKCDAHFVSVSIEDNGEGMSEEFIRTKLFQPFESTKAGKGMGVGVYQAREYIENLGGEIEVESTVGQGTKFTLRIPLAQA